MTAGCGSSSTAVCLALTPLTAASILQGMKVGYDMHLPVASQGRRTLSPRAAISIMTPLNCTLSHWTAPPPKPLASHLARLPNGLFHLSRSTYLYANDSHTPLLKQALWNRVTMPTPFMCSVSGKMTGILSANRASSNLMLRGQDLNKSLLF